jgi:hypothetical protein
LLRKAVVNFSDIQIKRCVNCGGHHLRQRTAFRGPIAEFFGFSGCAPTACASATARMISVLVTSKGLAPAMAIDRLTQTGSALILINGYFRLKSLSGGVGRFERWFFLASRVTDKWPIKRLEITSSATHYRRTDPIAWGLPMDRFIARENIKHYRRELQNGVDEPTRSTMLRLLVEEENHLGHTREQLGKLDGHISRLSEIIARHVDLMDNLQTIGQPSERASMVLATLNDPMAVYIAHRQKIKAILADGKGAWGLSILERTVRQYVNR